MSELRTDPLTGRQALVAENRAGRPSDFARPEADEGQDDSPRGDCAFCPGNEQRNPTPLVSRNDANGEWQMRVVPNKYPSVEPLSASSGRTMDGVCYGGHEVVIETRRHIDRTALLDESELAEVLRLYAERLDHWRRDGRFPYRLVFKNVGPAAGASLRHLHSQVITLPQVPPHVAYELQQLESRHAAAGMLPWQERLEEVLADGQRIVGEEEGIVAFCPYASRQPFETWLMPTDPQPFFEDLLDTPERFASVASLLHRLVNFVETKLAADYNVMVCTAPLVPGAERWFHWRIELAPRIGSVAGFELPTGLFVNTVSPEHAAEQLRAAIAVAAR